MQPACLLARACLVPSVCVARMPALPATPAPTLPRPTTLVPDQPSRPAMSSLNPLQRVRASHTEDIKLGLRVKRLVKTAAGEVVGGKISANFLRVSIAYIIVYSCMQPFTVADRW